MQAPLEEHIESETQEIVQKVQKQQANQINGKTIMHGILACVWL